MLQSLLQVVLEWVLGTLTPSNRVFGALGYSISATQIKALFFEEMSLPKPPQMLHVWNLYLHLA